MISVLIKAAMSFATKLLMSFASEALIEWAFFYIAEQIVKTTKTPHDDKFLEQAKKAYQENDK